MIKSIVIVLLSIAVTSCASLPHEAIVRYYTPRARIHVTATQTEVCSSTNLSSTFKAAAVVAYEAQGDPYFVRFNDLANTLSSSDLTINLTSDGRLQGVNATNTGEAATTAKGVADLSSSIEKTIKVPTFRKSEEGIERKYVCPMVIDKHGGSVTLSYEADLIFPDFYNLQILSKVSKSGIPMKIKLPINTTRNLDILGESHIHDLEIRILPKIKDYPLFSFQANEAKDKENCEIPMIKGNPLTYVCLRDTAEIDLSVVANANRSEDAQEVLAQTHFVVPVDRTYAIPLPKPTLFGKSSTKIALDPAGAITSIGFSKTSGAAELLETGAAIAAVAAVAATH